MFNIISSNVKTGNLCPSMLDYRVMFGHMGFEWRPSGLFKFATGILKPYFVAGPSFGDVSEDLHRIISGNTNGASGVA